MAHRLSSRAGHWSIRARGPHGLPLDALPISAARPAQLYTSAFAVHGLPRRGLRTISRPRGTPLHRASLRGVRWRLGRLEWNGLVSTGRETKLAPRLPAEAGRPPLHLSPNSEARRSRRSRAVNTTPGVAPPSFRDGVHRRPRGSALAALQLQRHIRLRRPCPPSPWTGCDVITLQAQRLVGLRSWRRPADGRPRCESPERK